jgi:hypothetical protein
MSAGARDRPLNVRFDTTARAILDGLVPLEFQSAIAGHGELPPHVRAASGLRRLAHRLVIVQDDVDALAVRHDSGAMWPVLLPARASGRRVFDDATGNKHEKLDLEACVVLADGRFVAFGSGSLPAREVLVVFSPDAPAVTVDAAELYTEVRGAVTRNETRLNIEGAVVSGAALLLFHRGNDAPRGSRAPVNAVIEIVLEEFARWLGGVGSTPRVARVTAVDLGDVDGVPFGFTDAVAIDAAHVVVLACAEDSACAISDGAVLGSRVGVLHERDLRLADIFERNGQRTRLKLEGIECRPGSDSEFDVVVDVDQPAVAAQLGRLVWNWR